MNVVKKLSLLVAVVAASRGLVAAVAVVSLHCRLL